VTSAGKPRAAWQVGIKFLDDVRGQTFGSGVGREGGQKPFKMLGDDLVKGGDTGVSRSIDGRYHILKSLMINRFFMVVDMTKS
jgi:hypothetical protein